MNCCQLYFFCNSDSNVLPTCSILRRVQLCPKHSGCKYHQICSRSIFGKEHLQIWRGKPKCKVILAKQDTCGYEPTHKQIATLSLLWSHIGCLKRKHKTQHHKSDKLTIHMNKHLKIMHTVAIVDKVALKWRLSCLHFSPCGQCLRSIFSLWTMSSVTFFLVDNVKWIGLCCPALNILLTLGCAKEMVSRNLPTKCSKIISGHLVLVNFLDNLCNQEKM